MIATDAMSLWLKLIRDSWLADIPCAELMNACHDWRRDLALSEYARLGWAEWRMKC